MPERCHKCKRLTEEKVRGRYYVCAPCKSLYEKKNGKLEWKRRVRSRMETFKKTKYKCPTCKRELLELVPDEYFLCKNFDEIYDKEHLLKNPNIYKELSNDTGDGS